MRLLLVEDNTDFAESVERALRSVPNCEFVWAASRDSALVKLNSESFDLVILDRKIPSADRVLDDDADHGWSVFQLVRGDLPGTPVWFLTGTVDADFATEINNSYGKIEDIHCRHNPEQMYKVFWKRRINDCVKEISDFATHWNAVDGVTVQCHPAALILTPERIPAFFGYLAENITVRPLAFPP